MRIYDSIPAWRKMAQYYPRQRSKIIMQLGCIKHQLRTHSGRQTMRESFSDTKFIVFINTRTWARGSSIVRNKEKTTLKFYNRYHMSTKCYDNRRKVPNIFSPRYQRSQAYGKLRVLSRASPTENQHWYLMTIDNVIATVGYETGCKQLARVSPVIFRTEQYFDWIA